MEDNEVGNILIKSGINLLIKGGKLVVGKIAPEALNLGAKVGNDFFEKQKNLIRIPDLKDVHIDEAIRILRDELHLIPTPVIAHPNLAFVDERENEVMYSKPNFRSRVNPRTTVKVYYLTQEVIDKSKALLGNRVQKFELPRVIGLQLSEAREDLEDLGLKVTEKSEKPSLRFSSKEEGQVTRITYPNNQKIGSKFKIGERVWLYYVSKEVLLESKSKKDQKVKDEQEKIEKIGKITKNTLKGFYTGAVDIRENVAKKIRKPFVKKKMDSDKNE